MHIFNTGNLMYAGKMYSENGQMCAIKEVRVVADDQSSKECLKQLNQVSFAIFSIIVFPIEYEILKCAYSNKFCFYI